jgi:hypothetical protein
MYLSQTPTITLGEVVEKWSSPIERWTGPLSAVAVRLDQTDGKVVEFGGHTVAATGSTIDALAGFLDIPTAFITRVDPDERQWIMTQRMARSAERSVTLHYSEMGGITEAISPTAVRIEPRQIARAMSKVLPPESMVTSHSLTVSDLRLDVVVPEAFERGIGGDRKVGDLTHGGVRIGQDRKANKAPYVQPYLYRLVCTNGMEIADDGIKIDARGASVEEVLAMLEAEAQRAFARVEGDIASFYDLRSQVVGPDKTGVLRRNAQDAGLPTRTIGVLEDTLPAVGSDDVTMFDLVNHMTNLANRPGIREGAARTLQRGGGHMINDHTARCVSCHQNLTTTRSA